MRGRTMKRSRKGRTMRSSRKGRTMRRNRRMGEAMTRVGEQEGA